MSERWEFEVEQGGMIVASGSCPDEQRAKAEVTHYCFMYAQDDSEGPVTGRWFREGSATTLASDGEGTKGASPDPTEQNTPMERE